MFERQVEFLKIRKFLDFSIKYGTSMKEIVASIPPIHMEGMIWSLNTVQNQVIMKD